MNIVFRVDGGLEIGSGHLMRCLTLADELKKRGSEVYFVCREFQKDITSLVEKRGHRLFKLRISQKEYIPSQGAPFHEKWLSVTWQQDAQDTIELIKHLNVEWLIVDHYGIDSNWHGLLRKYTNKIMVIDDLADRRVDCDILVNQTFGVRPERYSQLITSNCLFRLGPKYALLRPDFIELRKKALVKRQNFKGIKNILVFMGGVDSTNSTLTVLDALAKIDNLHECVINVVLGAGAPHLEEISELASNYPLAIKVQVDVINMSQLTYEADLAIGAGGTATWERCALALPSLITVLAENQRENADVLEKKGVVKVWRNAEELKYYIGCILSNYDSWVNMFNNVKNLCDGLGARRIANELINDSGL